MNYHLVIEDKNQIKNQIDHDDPDRDITIVGDGISVLSSQYIDDIRQKINAKSDQEIFTFLKLTDARTSVLDARTSVLTP